MAGQGGKQGSRGAPEGRRAGCARVWAGRKDEVGRGTAGLRASIQERVRGAAGALGPGLASG